jgi:hypothetical protein
MRWVEHVAHTEKTINAYKILFPKPEGKRRLRIHRHRREDNIRMNVKKENCEGLGWVELAPDRVQWWAVMNTMKNHLFPEGMGFVDQLRNYELFKKYPAPCKFIAIAL